LQSKGLSEVKLLDASGRLVQQQTIDGKLAIIQRNALPAGFYLVEVLSEGKVYREKLLMN
jgi:hypothetical protein